MSKPGARPTMKSKHTPGPWKASQKPTGSEWLISSVSWDDTGRSYAQFLGCAYVIANLETGEANARLIAAAPETAAERDRLKELCGELLVACKNYMENLEAGILVRDITRDHESGWAIRMLTFTTELEECQNAIAKATESLQ